MPADWAAQRIKNLSLSAAVLNAIRPKRNQKEITSLIEEFQYPKYGPGMMWEVAAEKVRKMNGAVHLKTAVTTVDEDGQSRTLVSAAPDAARQ
ncbi:hypothetical protein ABT297_00160 [Dactylosporangium sp. NPDC000555]|uniref:hypothetical protein n=1 Tax=Dactylosporangium sp. NPDC000555 TaxID=3154260 RepID=UPI003321EB2D